MAAGCFSTIPRHALFHPDIWPNIKPSWWCEPRCTEISEVKEGRKAKHPDLYPFGAFLFFLIPSHHKDVLAVSCQIKDEERVFWQHGHLARLFVLGLSGVGDWVWVDKIKKDILRKKTSRSVIYIDPGNFLFYLAAVYTLIVTTTLNQFFFFLITTGTPDPVSDMHITKTTNKCDIWSMNAKTSCNDGWEESHTG